MLVYTDYKKAKGDAPYCIALGSFDGVHLGHQKLIEIVASKGKELDCKSMVYTFFEHPKKILMPNYSPEMITENYRRIDIMERFGLDTIYFEKFQNVMKMSAETFIKEILISKFNVRCAVAGYNFSFGQKKDGNADMLKKYGKLYGFEVSIVDAVKINGDVVSSSLIRDIIKNGKVEVVKDYLGRHFSIDGTVIHGKKNGEKIGIRTANINMDYDIVLPKSGVYMTNTIVNNRAYKSVTNIGSNPTFNGKIVSIETHIMDFHGDLYGNKIEVVFLKWQREEQTFSSPLELKFQIMDDIRARIELN